MACQDIFCIFETADGELTPAFQQALALAKAANAHLTVVPLARKVTPPGASIASSLVSGAIATANAALREKAEAAAAAAKDAARIAGIMHEVAIREGMLGEVATWAGERARVADLTVVDRTTGALQSQETLFEQTLFASGRPVLVATASRIVERVEKICVAWNGSAVAARALGDALGLFPSIRKADVLCITSRKPAAGRVPGADAAQHLARHKIEATVVDLPLSEDSVAATIDGYARTSAADMTVMGGFGHSRLREFILGGVTRELSGTTSRPLLVAH